MPIRRANDLEAADNPAPMSNRRPALLQPRKRGMVAHIPQPGFWEYRLVAGGPALPAAIYRVDHEPGNPNNILDTGPVLIANIGYLEADPIKVWAGRRERALTEGQYTSWMAQLAWDREHGDPDAPALHPTKPVDFLTLKPIGPQE